MRRWRGWLTSTLRFLRQPIDAIERADRERESHHRLVEKLHTFGDSNIHHQPEDDMTTKKPTKKKPAPKKPAPAAAQHTGAEELDPVSGAAMPKHSEHS